MMHSAVKNGTTKDPWNSSDTGPTFGSTKLATAAIRGTLTLAMLSALLLIAARPTLAQTETVLHSFGKRIGDGVSPESRLTPDGKGNFYGTTPFGGSSVYGTIFELSPNRRGGWNETVIYRFTGGVDGAEPDLSHVIFDNAGNLYGTTFFGGAYGLGVVFELSPVGANWTETVLHSFGGYAGDGAKPVNGLIMDSAGNLYGTTAFGGSGGTGTVFELSPSGGGWTEQVIDNVESTSAGLTMDAAGNIFGTSISTVFELAPNGSGGWNPTVLHTFAGARSKHYIYANGTPVFDKAGNLYGTTYEGGNKNNGTVYRLSPAGNGQWTFSTLHSFQGYPFDGGNPDAGVVLDAAGNIYGTTCLGGKYGPGTVFELVSPVGKDGYKEKVLWNFNGKDGYLPMDSPMLDSAGNLYGTTIYGGSADAGVAFKVTR